MIEMPQSRASPPKKNHYPFSGKMELLEISSNLLLDKK